MQNLSDNIFRLALSFNDMYESSQRIDEFKRIFDMKSAFEDGEKRFQKLNGGPGIEFQDVSFSYPGSKPKVIKNLNLKIRPGEKVAIVGHNGAGKTTFVKLACRFYKASQGKILINGVDITEVKGKSWYRNIAVLFQDYNTYPQLSARENIMIGKVGGAKGRVIRASKMARAHEFIKEYKDGYEQILSEKFKGGTRPSTGQWQKIAIARFFYRNAPLIIFDEPTASIDAVSEKKIFDKIYRFFKGKTVIIISHRFSTVRNADRIIVFDKGRIVEQGSHEELVALGGVYARAFGLQAEGYAKN